MLGRSGTQAGRWIVAALAAVAGLAVATPVAGATTAPARPGFSTVWDHGHLQVVRDGAGATYSAAALGASDGETVATHETDSTVHQLGAADPMRGDQWALDAVPFESTWSLTRGGGVIVAVVDTGVLG